MDDHKILVFGVGNEILADDAIGPKLSKKLNEELPLPNVTYNSAFFGGLEIIDFVEGYKEVIFIDAIKTLNGIPGAVYYFTPDDFKETLNLSNIHDVSFLTALKMGGELNYEMPDKIHIIAIEIVEDLVFSNDFSPEVQKRYPEIVKEVKEYVLSLVK